MSFATGALALKSRAFHAPEDGQTWCVTAEVSTLSGELTITRTELVELDDDADSDDDVQIV